MSCYVGIDIGAVSITAALLAEPGKEAAFAEGGFRPAGRSRFGASDLYLSAYRRTRGRPIQAATELLEQIIAGTAPKASPGCA